MPDQLAPLTVTGDTHLDEVIDDFPPYGYLYADGHPWLFTCNQDGDWWALRFPTEDDPVPHPVIVTLDGDHVPYPWQVLSAEQPLMPTTPTTEETR